MNKTIRLSALMLLSLCLAPLAAADVKEKLEAAMAADSRPQADKDRDANRKPVETLAFFGLKDDMRVLELLPGGAWYTRLLAPVLQEKGKLYAAIGTQRVEAMLASGELTGVEVVQTKGEFVRPEGQRRFQLDGLEIPVDNLDMVLTFRNMHNFTEQGRKDLNAATFKALKKGGLYGVVDHTRRHMQEDNYENWRRMDPVEMIKEIEAAGFEFVDYSTLHYRPDDELRYEVGRKTVTGNTDRFTLLFRKP
ncbi:MAG: hypothetical protein R3E86_18315 [Pseudomonadales bacterium]